MREESWDRKGTEVREKVRELDGEGEKRQGDTLPGKLQARE